MVSQPSVQNGWNSHAMSAHNHNQHCPGHGANQRTLIPAIGIIFIFALIEAGTGWWAHSLALLSDAGHMASDAVALSIAAFAAWVAAHPPSTKHTYGLGRAEIVSAWFSSFTMILLSIWIIIEALERLESPLAVKSTPMILIGALGIIVNIAVAFFLMRGQRTLNIRGALLHVFGDLLGSVAALAAGCVIAATHWKPIDPILSIFISCLILIASIRLLKESILVLMEGTPSHIDIDQVKQALSTIDGIHAIHDLHIWTLSSGVLILSAHININTLSEWPVVLSKLRAKIKKNYGISHVTLQPEPTIINCQPCNH